MLSKVKSCFILVHGCLLVALGMPSETLAQQKTDLQNSYSYSGTPRNELFFEILSSSDADKVEIYWDKGHESSPTLRKTLLDDGTGFTNVCSAASVTYHWVAEVSGGVETFQCSPITYLNENELYTITIKAFDGATLEDEISFLYINCNDDAGHEWDDTIANKKKLGFYCIYTNTGDQNDLSIELNSSGFQIIPTELGSTDYKYINDVFTDSKWIYPHHAVYYCANAVVSGQSGSTSSCEEEALNTRYLVMPYQGSLDNYELTSDADLKLKEHLSDSPDVYFEGMDLTFASGTELVVEADVSLEIENSEVDGTIKVVGDLHLESSTVISSGQTVLTTGSNSYFSSSYSYIESGNNEYTIESVSSGDINLYPSGDGGNEILGKGLNAVSGGTISSGDDIALVGEQHFCRDTGSVTLRADGSGSIANGEQSYYPSGNAPTSTETNSGVVEYGGNLGSSTCSASKRGNGLGLNPAFSLEGNRVRHLRSLALQGDWKGMLRMADELGAPAEVSERARAMSVFRLAYKVSPSGPNKRDFLNAASKFATQEYPLEYLDAQLSMRDGNYIYAGQLLGRLLALPLSSDLRNRVLIDATITRTKLEDYQKARELIGDLDINSAEIARAGQVVENAIPLFSSNESIMDEQIGKSRSSTTDVPNTPDETSLVSALFPNPATESINIQFQNQEVGSVSIDVYNMLGQLVKSTSIDAQSMGIQSARLDLSELPVGVLIVRVATERTAETLLVQKF